MHMCSMCIYCHGHCCCPATLNNSPFSCPHQPRRTTACSGASTRARSKPPRPPPAIKTEAAVQVPAAAGGRKRGAEAAPKAPGSSKRARASSKDGSNSCGSAAEPCTGERAALLAGMQPLEEGHFYVEKIVDSELVQVGAWCACSCRACLLAAAVRMHSW